MKLGKGLVIRLFTLVAVLAVLAACVAPGMNPGAESAPAAASGSKVKVVYWAHNFEPRVELDKKYIDEFMKDNPDIEVDYEVIPSDFDAKLRTALASGQGPDLFAQWNGDMGTFYAQDAIAPVSAEAIGLASQEELMQQYVAPENTLQGASLMANCTESPMRSAFTPAMSTTRSLPMPVWMPKRTSQQHGSR